MILAALCELPSNTPFCLNLCLITQADSLISRFNERVHVHGSDASSPLNADRSTFCRHSFKNNWLKEIGFYVNQLIGRSLGTVTY